MATPDPASDLLEPFRISSLPPAFYYIPNFITPEEEASILQKIPPSRWHPLSHRRLQAHPTTLTKSNTLLASPLPSYLTSPIIPRFAALRVFDQTPHKAPNHVLINEYRKGEGIMAHEDGGAYAEVVATVSLGGTVCLEISSKPGTAESGPDCCARGSAAAIASSALSALPSDPSDPAPDLAAKASTEGFAEDGNSPPENLDPPAPLHLPSRILQEPRSLLLTTSLAYSSLLHGIPAVEADTDLCAATVSNWDLLGDSGVFEKAGGRNERGTRVSLTYRDVLRVSGAAGRVLGGLRRV
ncbi:hypothetical protein K432DRAFT_418544 [Lepidopterella palustris CBS 459.81]|uniref:Fe2OG dioxygenase domain-containing protein n=1 Tax=Lepidopterella palustris CBS 459.81 TaxID=1314670 RepID=A0A8E2E542_9PEZI|nr:hypothetical protein K432DRAFT_418544 [Lepidopterella palustris CBS 459.81]